MNRKQVYFGIIGLGLMGKEFASAAARWCHLTDNLPVPVIKGICNRSNLADRKWFQDNFPGIEIVTDNYKDLLRSDTIDAVYCAVPHNLHQEQYINIIEAGKHLLGEKPFGIDLSANENILKAAAARPDLKAFCSSEFVYFPGANRIIDWIKAKRYGRLIEVRCGFHHSSDMDLAKPINWKRIAASNGEYGCMGDLGFHIHLIPLRMGWYPETVFGSLQNIARERPDRAGKMVVCDTWDNATVICTARDPENGELFSLTFETKRMAPGATNTWFIEVYGTAGSAKFSTHEPKAFYTLETMGKEQGWTRTDIGAATFLPTITGSIFETGFSDALLQMIGAFMTAFDPNLPTHPFPCGLPEETNWSHRIMTAALESQKTGKIIQIKKT
jgi:predicted dehydrogenase